MSIHLNRLLAFKPAQADLVSLGLSAAKAGLADSISRPLLRTFGVNPWSAAQRDTKLIFLHIAKCAGTSLLRQLPKGIVGASNNHYAALQFWAHDASAFHESFKFAVVRCPVQRFASAWKYALASGRCGPIRNRVPTNVNQCAELLEQPLGRRYLWSAPHFRPQVAFLLAPVPDADRDTWNQGRTRIGIGVDVVVRLDKFAEGLETVSRRLGIQLRSDLVFNATESYPSLSVSAEGCILSERSKKIIMRFYRNDLALYRAL